MKKMQAIMNKSIARNVIKACSEDSARVRVTEHAFQKMKERGITLKQVLNCLKSGNISEGPYQEAGKETWKCNVDGISAGQFIRVVVAIDMRVTPEQSIVVTAFSL